MAVLPAASGGPGRANEVIAAAKARLSGPAPCRVAASGDSHNESPTGRRRGTVVRGDGMATLPTLGASPETPVLLGYDHRAEVGHTLRAGGVPQLVQCAPPDITATRPSRT